MRAMVFTTHFIDGKADTREGILDTKELLRLRSTYVDFHSWNMFFPSRHLLVTVKEPCTEKACTFTSAIWQPPCAHSGLMRNLPTGSRYAALNFPEGTYLGSSHTMARFGRY